MSASTEFPDLEEPGAGGQVPGLPDKLIYLPTKAAGSWSGIGGTWPGCRPSLSFVVKDDVANGGLLL